MNEEKIIDFLKKNKTKGIAFAFLPKEVQRWCCDHDSSLIYYQTNNVWNDNSANDVLFESNEIVALPEDFELQKKSQGCWVEFEINDKACFHTESGDFLWFNWEGFLIQDYISKKPTGFTAFGGWQFESNGCWYTDPQMIDENEELSTLVDYHEKSKPAIPCRIRFWRKR